MQNANILDKTTRQRDEMQPMPGFCDGPRQQNYTDYRFRESEMSGEIARHRRDRPNYFKGLRGIF
jgi:hypothetical protein